MIEVMATAGRSAYYRNSGQYEPLAMKIYEKVCEIAGAWHADNYTELGDVLQYDCLPLLKSIEQEVQATLVYEGKNHDFH